MNVLFHTYNKVSSTKGGTERATITVATSLKILYGAHCFSIYEMDADSVKEDCFVNEFRWTPRMELDGQCQSLNTLIRVNRINCVIIQGSFVHVPRFKSAVGGTSCKVIFAHHFEPRWELVFGSFGSIMKDRPNSLRDSARWIKRVLLYPWMASNRERQLSSAYRMAYKHADTVVLLSRSFIKPFGEFGGIQDASKYVVIPNGLSFDFYPCLDKVSKRKVALIVSRLDETSKRLSLALRIWELVKQDPIAKDWTLKIVGHGNDRMLYENMIKEANIPDVSLLGRQDPVPFYEEASLFLMTSRSESWGLTLTEAQQMGVVPIAFNTYASLREIITNGENGVAIAEGDVSSYVNWIKVLMSNTELRQYMASQAISSSRRFSKKRIAEMWWSLISEQ